MIGICVIVIHAVPILAFRVKSYFLYVITWRQRRHWWLQQQLWAAISHWCERSLIAQTDGLISASRSSMPGLAYRHITYYIFSPTRYTFFEATLNNGERKWPRRMETRGIGAAGRPHHAFTATGHQSVASAAFYRRPRAALRRERLSLTAPTRFSIIGLSRARTVNMKSRRIFFIWVEGVTHYFSSR